MRRREVGAFRVVVLVIALGVPGAAMAAAQTPPDALREELRLRVESSAERRDEWILARLALPRFYENRAYEPVWVGDGTSLPPLDALVARIEEVRSDGLEPGDYHLARLTGLRSEVRSRTQGTRVPVGLLVELELRATDAFLMLTSHLVAGRTDPESLRAEWIAARREASPTRRLEEAIASGRLRESLDELAPAYPEYARLVEARHRYEQIALGGGWPTIDPGPKLELGTIDPRVGNLLQRLRITGDIGATSTSTTFDEDVEQGVVRFQRRHGLDPDGIVGPATLLALNISARDRMRQIEVNLERWRWLPQDLGSPYVLVNIPNFELDVVEDGEIVMNMRAVVGRPYRRTPVFSDRISYIVLNPRWNVPQSIATQDILPKLQTDANYLVNQNMKLFLGWGADQRELRQGDVDWSQVTARNFNFHVRQEPGPTNALGRVKFMFPNQFNVYLHDTPARELFSRNDRTFSSGCIRLERPLELATYLLSSERNWTRQDLDAALARGVEQSVTLPNSIPVHLLYWTAWVASDDQMQFRNDIYSRDTPVREALDSPPPRG